MSIVNSSVVVGDAIGACIIDQTRFLLRRGDIVRIYVVHPPRDLPSDIAAVVQTAEPADLLERRDAHFAQSDLYVYHYPAHYSLIDSMSYLDRGAVLFYYHNVTPPGLWGNDFERDVLQYSRDSVRQLALYADLIVTDSAFNAQDLIREHGCEADRVRVLPLAVPLERFMPGPKDLELVQQYHLTGKQVVLFVGRMAGNKRIDLLVEALSSVKQHVPNAVLLLVGDDRGNPALEENVNRARQLAAELGVEHDVIFTGPVVDQAPYYRLARVYASASLHEGFGVPLIEAMASGVPLVISNTTAHPWVAGEAGLLAEPKSAEDLARQIVRVLTDDALCGDLVRRGLARAKEFTLEQYENGWGQIVAEATAWLPDQPYPFIKPLTAEAPLREKKASVRPASPLVSRPDLQWLEAHADVMIRGYVVRSNLPLVGKFIAWIRRNMTSHLREPYLDPMFERQVAFNRHLTQALQQYMEQTALNLDKMTSERQKIDARLQQIEVGLNLISGQLTALDQAGALDERSRDIQQQIEALRQTLGSNPNP